MTIDGFGTRRVSCLLCPNPGPMTLDGTNTWVLREPGSRGVVVVDPGPLHERHLERVARSVQEYGGQVVSVLLTHTHDDHCGGAPYFAELTGAPVRAFDPAYTRDSADGPLADNERITVDGLQLRILHTPGHTWDSVCIQLPAEGEILTGDTILGRGTTVLDGGGLGDYLDSLQRLADLAAESGAPVLLPGHGPTRSDPVGTIREYLDHRHSRLDQVRAAVADGARTPDEVVTRVYVDLEQSLVRPALASVRAQIRYLADRGELPEDMDAGG